MANNHNIQERGNSLVFPKTSKPPPPPRPVRLLQFKRFFDLLDRHVVRDDGRHVDLAFDYP